MIFKALILARQKPVFAKRLLLLLCWITGLILGLHISKAIDSDYHTLCYTAARAPAGLIGLFAVFFFPLMVYIAAGRIKRLYLFFVIAVWHSFLYSFNMGMIYAVFASSAWLVSFFLLFSGTFASFMILYLLWQRTGSNVIPLKKSIIIYSAVALPLVLLDYFCISKFLSNIL